MIYPDGLGVVPVAQALRKHDRNTNQELRTKISAALESPSRGRGPECMTIVELQSETESLLEITRKSPPQSGSALELPGACFAKHTFPREKLTQKVQGKARQVYLEKNLQWFLFAANFKNHWFR